MAILASAGLVSAGDSSREGRRPERVRYAITPDGRESLTAWVAQALADPGRGEECPAALSFMFALGRDQATEILQGRAAALTESLDTGEAALARAEKDGVPPIFLSDRRYQPALRRAERDWLPSPNHSALACWPGRTRGRNPVRNKPRAGLPVPRLPAASRPRAAPDQRTAPRRLTMTRNRYRVK